MQAAREEQEERVGKKDEKSRRKTKKETVTALLNTNRVTHVKRAVVRKLRSPDARDQAYQVNDMIQLCLYPLTSV